MFTRLYCITLTAYESVSLVPSVRSKDSLAFESIAASIKHVFFYNRETQIVWTDFVYYNKNYYIIIHIYFTVHTLLNSQLCM